MSLPFVLGIHEFFLVQDVWHAHATMYSVGVAFEDTLLVGHCKRSER